MARKKYEPTDIDREEIQRMAGRGMTNKDMALVKGICETTLKENYKEDIKIGRAKSRNEFSESMFKLACSGKNPAITIFWAKCQLRWRENKKIKYKDKNADAMPKITSGMDPIEAAKIYQKLMSGE